jgi:hypothetical protein
LPLTILGEQSLFRRPTNHRGKPVLAGFSFTFSAPLNAASAASSANYQVDTLTTKRVKGKDQHILDAFTDFTVSYNAASDSVSLALDDKQGFQGGGKITVIGGPSGGVTGTSGATLAASAVFTITKGGNRIVPG